MEGANGLRPVPLPWKLGVLTPLILAVVLALISITQGGRQREIELTLIGGIFLDVSMILLGVYWIVVRKLTALGITALILWSAVLGFGVHVLLRTL